MNRSAVKRADPAGRPLLASPKPKANIRAVRCKIQSIQYETQPTSILWTPVRIPPTPSPGRRGRIVNACIFCGARPPLTAEHVWSHWLGTEVPDLGHVGTEVSGVVGVPTTWRRQRRKASSLKPKIVCASCNNGWMSRLQERAKPHLLPLIRGDDCRLDAAAQELVATWLTMTAMTACWANRDYGSWAIPQEHRTAVYSTGKPPLATQVWIAPCSHEDRLVGTPAFGMRYRLIRLDHLNGTTLSGLTLPARPGYGAALSVGSLAALLFGHTYEPPVRPQVGFTGLIARACKQIWPTSTVPVEFPRDLALDHDGFNMLIKVLEQWQ